MKEPLSMVVTQVKAECAVAMELRSPAHYQKVAWPQKDAETIDLEAAEHPEEPSSGSNFQPEATEGHRIHHPYSHSLAHPPAEIAAAAEARTAAEPAAPGYSAQRRRRAGIVAGADTAPQ